MSFLQGIVLVADTPTIKRGTTGVREALRLYTTGRRAGSANRRKASRTSWCHVIC
jgi:hypothetical protein